MGLEDEVREAMRTRRSDANKTIDVRNPPPDDTVALSIMLSGLSQGVEDALVVIAREVEKLSGRDPGE